MKAVLFLPVILLATACASPRAIPNRASEPSEIRRQCDPGANEELCNYYIGENVHFTIVHHSRVTVQFVNKSGDDWISVENGCVNIWKGRYSSGYRGNGGKPLGEASISVKTLEQFEGVGCPGVTD